MVVVVGLGATVVVLGAEVVVLAAVVVLVLVVFLAVVVLPALVVFLAVEPDETVTLVLLPEAFFLPLAEILAVLVAGLPSDDAASLAAASLDAASLGLV